MTKLAAIVLGLALVVIVPFLVWGDLLEQMFTGDGAVEWLTDLGSFAWLAAIGLLIADLAMPIPTTVVMAALGMVYGPVVGGIVGAAGSVISGLIGYGLCLHFGRPLALWMNGQRALDQGQRLFSRAGGWMVALSRWLPVASEVVACMAGLSRMQFRVFASALVCGSVPLGFVFSTIGHLGIERPILTLALSAILPFGLWFLARRWFSEPSAN
jgi:uncharacterized membrane protein YdjX (TVP38/TMEM64 family)